MKVWYTVTAMKVRDTHLINPKMVKFDFFGDPNSDEGYALVIEIAQNKLHTTEGVALHFKLQEESETENNSYTKEEIEEIVKDFETKGYGVKEARTENGALIIKWKDPQQTGKEESTYYKIYNCCVKESEQ